MGDNIWLVQEIQYILNMTLTLQAKITAVSINSHDIQKDHIFIALKGQHYDGGNFIPHALGKGAAFCIANISESKNIKDKNNVVFVKDTFILLKKMAHFRRQSLKGRVIAVTGSAGKTSIKEFFTRILQLNYGSCFSSIKNYNNIIGVSLSLCNTHNHYKFYIFELGMNHAGEILVLSQFIRPHVSIITNIQAVHIKNFSSIIEVAMAKTEIIYAMKKYTVCIYGNEFCYQTIVVRLTKNEIRSMTFGSKQSHCFIKYINVYKVYREVYVTCNAKVFKISLPNNLAIYNIYNVQALILCLQELKLAPLRASHSFMSFKSLPGRGEVIYLHQNIIVLNDTYNASPDALLIAIKDLLLYKHPSRRTVLIIGDMLELGINKNKIHQNIDIKHIDRIFCVGELSKELFHQLPKEKKGTWFIGSDAMAEHIIDYIVERDVILVKGSNTVKMESIILRLKNIYQIDNESIVE